MRGWWAGSKRNFLAAGVLFASLVSPLWAETLTCDNTSVSVDFHDRQVAELICETVEQAATLFKQCGEIALPERVNVTVVQEIERECVALYHCGEFEIEVLAPPAMKDKRDPEGAFAFLPEEEYFRSVIVHELTHAASDVVPCPIEICVATDEYVAYAMQVMSLTPDARAVFEARTRYDRKISRDELSPMILFMAPDLFTRKAWNHFSQRDDPCGFIEQLAEKTILLDRERF